jgi:hypothetical protein
MKETKPNTFENVQLEEYRALREEMRQRQAAMTQLFLASLVAAVALISGITAFYFNVYTKNPGKIPDHLALILLAPILIIIPILYIIRSHRRDIRRFASYIQVFFEETGCGLKWETAHDKWTDTRKEEGHDAVPWTFWVLGFVCFGLYWIGLDFSKVSNKCLYVIIPLLVFFIFMLHAHVTYAKSKDKYHRECLKLWRTIQSG